MEAVVQALDRSRDQRNMPNRLTRSWKRSERWEYTQLLWSAPVAECRNLKHWVGSERAESLELWLVIVKLGALGTGCHSTKGRRFHTLQ